LQHGALLPVVLAAASQQTRPEYASQWTVHAPPQILLIKQRSTDKIGMVK
jgi:hypothetical protein